MDLKPQLMLSKRLMKRLVKSTTEFVEIEMCEEEFTFFLPSLPKTLCKSPAAKQRKTEGGDTSAILSQHRGAFETY